MRGIIALIRRQPEAEPDYVEYEPLPPARSMVGNMVVTLDSILARHRTNAANLQAEIEAKNEHLRQTLAVIRATEAALVNIAGDPALTDDERAVASEPLETAAIELMERELAI